MDGAESHLCSSALSGRGTIITMTSEEDRYYTRTDCRVLEQGQFEDEEGGGRGERGEEREKKK